MLGVAYGGGRVKPVLAEIGDSFSEAKDAVKNSAPVSKAKQALARLKRETKVAVKVKEYQKAQQEHEPNTS